MIAALDRNRAIGRSNALPWHLPDDLRRFKALTLGGTVLMGRKTAQSLGRALPKRRNLVLTRGGVAPFDGMTAVASFEAALGMLARDEPLFVIGGAQVYAQALPRATHLHLTWVDLAVEDADTWFPAVDPDGWTVAWREAHGADAAHAAAFEFVDYVRG
nr:dihydrofolate reductase [Chiayiivirga flava]